MNRSFYATFSIIGYVTLFLFNLFMLFFLGNYFNLIFFVAMVIIPILSYASIRYLANRIEVSVTGAALVENRDDDFFFNINIDNPTMFFSNNCILEIKISNKFFDTSQTHSVVLPATPFSSATVTYPLKSQHCGILNVDITEFCIYDALNFFHIKKSIAVHKEIPIYPSPKSTDNTVLSDLSNGCDDKENMKKGYDATEVSNIREYIPGDRLSDIHWKLSAKENNLMVKEHIQNTSKELTVFVDLSKKNSEIIDLILDHAYGIGIYLNNSNLSFVYMWYSSSFGDFKSVPCYSRKDINNAMMDILYDSLYDEDFDINNSLLAITGDNNYFIVGEKYVLKEETK